MAKTKESLKTQIYNAILDHIFSGEFKPGQILNEKELVEKFGCSKAPVREALIALCSDNVLRSFPRYGYEIIRLDYGQDIHTFHGRTPAELEPIIKLAIKRTLPQLENVPFSEYDDIIFISKSIGTTIACQLETALQLKGKVHQFLMTPIPSTLRYLSDINGLFFAGTADPYMP